MRDALELSQGIRRLDPRTTDGKGQESLCPYLESQPDYLPVTLYDLWYGHCSSELVSPRGS